MSALAWQIELGRGPLIATAIHAGHDLCGEVRDLIALDDEARLREEDPYTGEWARAGATSVVVTRSRFEVDMNRPREKAVYRTPDDAWGLDIWASPPPNVLVEASLALYDAFYKEVGSLIASVVEREGFAIVLDLHSYNHVRGGRDAAPAAIADNPDVNVGTDSLDMDRWGTVADAFISGFRVAAADPSLADILGPIDVRENVKFRGGAFPNWVNTTFPGTACALAVEFKKTFMNEWTGEIDRVRHGCIGEALGVAADEALRAARERVRP